ncbi:helix-turn-helix domain-containing protein [Streptomyces aidingensis]|uniref:Helix-turn-helix domain-containing protein n=1 Tax=Streptomyces aidingensis TaxID=910347 RepID=A0A1I1S1I4_9ACTN|nr:helix-turn-helix transcriptional regulator [Streptomyces aidingensis]SFD40369.1 Helix-turn-helix domain-containing protein [Streptomyces aidingensis]
MMTRPVATVRRYRLGVELRRLREHAGVTQETAGECIDADDSKISRVESGRSPLSRPELVELLRLYGVTEEHEAFAGLIELNRESRRRGWWQQPGVIGRAPAQLIDLETSASTVFEFSPLLVPELLQTERYAGAALAAAEGAAETETERAVRIRLQRQELLDRPDGPELDFVLDEAVLHRPVGGPRVQAEQLRRLAALAGRERLTVRVVPFTGGAHAGTAGSGGGFRLFGYSGPPRAEYGCAEQRDGRVLIEDGEAAGPYREAAGRLHGQALGAEESVKLIGAVAERMAARAPERAPERAPGQG